MKKDTIFIHIPKTGGTTINAAMQGTYWASEPGFNYRHILLKEKRSNSADIFNTSNLLKYKEHTIFMMVRDPVDRLISEYYFLKERKNFMDLLRIKPKSFEDYIRNPQTQNYMVGFLVGRRIFDINPAKEIDLDNVLDAIEGLPIHTGIFEHFNESLSYFSSVSDITWE
jgi:Sulfotransferase family.